MTQQRANPHTVGNAELRCVFHAEHLMSMPALHQRQWTVDEVERLADEQVEPTQRYELANGELLVTPSPTDRHQRIVVRELFRSVTRVREAHIDWVKCGSDRRARASRSNARFEPDIFVVPTVIWTCCRGPMKPSRRYFLLSKCSPQDRRATIASQSVASFKRTACLSIGSSMASPRRSREWRPDDARAVLVDDRLSWRPELDVPALEIDVRVFFADVADPRP